VPLYSHPGSLLDAGIVYAAGLDTLKRLRLDCIDSMQVHDPEFAPSVDIILNQTLPALQKLKQEGKIRLIGMTGYPLALQQVPTAQLP